MSAEAPKAAVEDLIAKVVGGKALDAFDRYGRGSDNAGK